MAVDWEATVASLVPVVVGIAIGFLLTPLADVWSNRRKRKKLAAVLACEVEAIRAMAARSIEVNEPNVAVTRKTLELATQAVADLERIGKTKVAGKVSVSTGEVLTGSTGPAPKG